MEQLVVGGRWRVDARNCVRREGKRGGQGGKASTHLGWDRNSPPQRGSRSLHPQNNNTIPTRQPFACSSRTKQGEATHHTTTCHSDISRATRRPNGLAQTLLGVLVLRVVLEELVLLWTEREAN
jgi:hypothetical protein